MRLQWLPRVGSPLGALKDSRLPKGSRLPLLDFFRWAVGPFRWRDSVLLQLGELWCCGSLQVDVVEQQAGVVVQQTGVVESRGPLFAPMHLRDLSEDDHWKCALGASR